MPVPCATPCRLPLLRLPQLGRHRAAGLRTCRDRRSKRGAGGGGERPPALLLQSLRLCCCMCHCLRCGLPTPGPPSPSQMLGSLAPAAWPLPMAVDCCTPLARGAFAMKPTKPHCCLGPPPPQKIACTPNDGFVAKDDRTGGRIDSTAAVPIGRNGCYMQLPYMQYCLKVGAGLPALACAPGSRPVPLLCCLHRAQANGASRCLEPRRMHAALPVPPLTGPRVCAVPRSALPTGGCARNAQAAARSTPMACAASTAKRESRVARGGQRMQHRHICRCPCCCCRQAGVGCLGCLPAIQCFRHAPVARAEARFAPPSSPQYVRHWLQVVPRDGVPDL